MKLSGKGPWIDKRLPGPTLDGPVLIRKAGKGLGFDQFSIPHPPNQLCLFGHMISSLITVVSSVTRKEFWYHFPSNAERG